MKPFCCHNILTNFLFCYRALIYFFVFWNFCRTIIFCEAHFKTCRWNGYFGSIRTLCAKGERYFQGYYLKLCRSKDIKVKKIYNCASKKRCNTWWSLRYVCWHQWWSWKRLQHIQHAYCKTKYWITWVFFVKCTLMQIWKSP